MNSRAFKEIYRGNGIYYHFAARMYGDETKPLYRTVAEYKAAIDAYIAQMDNIRPDHEKYWDTLPHSERNKWRRLCFEAGLSAAELAYKNR